MSVECVQEESEMQRAVDAFYTAMIGRHNYQRWLWIKRHQCFTSEAKFTGWVLDVLQQHLDTQEARHGKSNGEDTDISLPYRCLVKYEADAADCSAGQSPPHDGTSALNEAAAVAGVKCEDELANEDDDDGGYYRSGGISTVGVQNDEEDTWEEMPGEGDAQCAAMFDSPECLSTHRDAVRTSGEQVQWTPEHMESELYSQDGCSGHTDGESAVTTDCEASTRAAAGWQRNDDGFTCRFCCKRFTIKGNRYRHEQTVHYRQRAHVCLVCRRAFTQSGSLKRHLLNQHGSSHTHLPPHTHTDNTPQLRTRQQS